MNNSQNPNISKQFRKAIEQVRRWRKNKNPVVTTVKEVRKNKDKETPVFHRGPANEVWGRPNTFSMK